MTELATVEDVPSSEHPAPVEEVVEPAADLLHDAADASAEAAEDLHDTAGEVLDGALDTTSDIHHAATEHEMHAETRRIVAEGFERVEGRLTAVENKVGIGATQPADDIGEGGAEVLSEPGEAVEDTVHEVHTRRRRMFKANRKR